MIGTFYSKTALKDTLMINVSDHKPNSIKEESKYSIGYDQDNKICFVNIFNFSRYLELKEGFIKFNSEINEILNKVCSIDLSEFIDTNDFIVSKVAECVPIEGTHLHKCKVFNGSETFDVVCGAKNVMAGINVVFAMDQAILPNGQRIKKGKILGNISNGMLCSAKELNLIDKEFNSVGIIELSSKYQIGQKFDEVFTD